ncbi:MAG TPA: hypothetical protein VMU62_03325, partial [Acidobacteriaceae bacterium]|nr:hypothetical protein [Acidobacteriaceae bacterium]
MKIPLEHPTPLTHRFLRSLATAVLCASVFTGMGLSARAADKPASDVLVFLNGDKITGQLEKVTGGTVFFKTDGAGELQVPWAKIKELHTDEPFAVILTNAKVRRRHRNRQVSVGSLNVEDQNLTVHTEAGEQVIPVSTIAFLVDEKSYRNDVDHTPGLAHGWVGAITAGAGTVTSTQNSVSYNAGIALARTIPSSTWLAPSYRTLLGFTTNYGRISQPATPTVKTNIFHALAEQDKYLSPRLYALAEAVFDHSSTQGLDLQSMYGGGLG